jgi:hypothetical protein
MPIVQIDNSEISALATYVAARQPAGAVVNGLVTRLQAAATVAIKAAARDLFAAGIEGVIYQAQVDAALAVGVPQNTINKIVTATVGSITPNPTGP